MNLSQCEQALDEQLRVPLADRGFGRSGTLDFMRPTPPGGETLRFRGRMDEQQRCQISGTAGVIFRSIEEILRGGNQAAGSLRPTIVVPLHMLHADRKYFEWAMNGPDDAHSVAPEILEDVTSHARPFFVRYKEIGDLRRALESPNPADWFVLTREDRVMILAAIEHVSGSPEGALRLLDQALAERVNDLPKKRYPLQQLRARLSSSLTAE